MKLRYNRSEYVIIALLEAGEALKKKVRSDLRQKVWHRFNNSLVGPTQIYRQVVGEPF